jgi:2-polyprenyl-3-methyl-5-hydroxy-6-metoxy-1,4-benzoquinol methylase
MSPAKVVASSVTVESLDGMNVDDRRSAPGLSTVTTGSRRSSMPGTMAGMSHSPIDWAERGQDLVRDAEVNAPMVEQALSWVAGQTPRAKRLLDIGSGPGVAACTLAQLLPDAEVLAADGAAPLLDLAHERAGRLGVAERLRTRRITLPDDLPDLPAADLVWVSGVVHHLPDPTAAVAALAALVRPDGLLALREGGMPQQYLPPYADRGLAARVTALSSELAHRQEHPMGVRDATKSWPALLREAGLAVRSRTFLLDRPEPLDERSRHQLRRGLRLARDNYSDRLTAEDRARLDELTADDGPESVLHRPDVFLLRATTVHVGARLSS